MLLTLLGLTAVSLLLGTIGGKLLGIRMLCPQNGNGVLKGIMVVVVEVEVGGSGGGGGGGGDSSARLLLGDRPRP